MLPAVLIVPSLIRTAHGTLLAGDPAAPFHAPPAGAVPPLLAVPVGLGDCLLAGDDGALAPYRLGPPAAPRLPLRRLDGALLTALPDGRVALDRRDIGDWELFCFEPAPAPHRAPVTDPDRIYRDPASGAGLVAALLALADMPRRRDLLSQLAARPDYADIFARLRRFISGGLDRSPWHTHAHLRWGIDAHGWRVGDHTYGHPTIVDGEYGSLSIGRYCSIAGDVRIVIANHLIDTVTTYPFASLAYLWPSAPDDGRADHAGTGVVIGHSVWIGQGALILPGARVGDGAIVGAGAVVAKPVAPYAVVVGNPARVTRIRFAAAIVERLLAVRWWDWPDERVDAFVPRLLSGDILGFLEAAEGGVAPFTPTGGSAPRPARP